MKNTVYMQVTKDRFELPVVIADTAVELARICGVSENSIHRTVNASGGKTGYKKYIKVVLED